MKNRVIGRPRKSANSRRDHHLAIMLTRPQFWLVQKAARVAMKPTADYVRDELMRVASYDAEREV